MKLARSHFSPVRPLAAFVLAAPAASLLAPPAPPPSVPNALDLKTAITFALENIFAIRQARERIRQQEGIVVEVTARAIPNVNADGTYQRSDEELSPAFPPSDQAWTINLVASQA